MFCPNCKYEYPEGAKICPDCGAKLVKELPPEPPHPDFEFEELTDVDSEADVSVITGMLEQEDIESFERSNLYPHSNVVMSQDPQRKRITIFVNGKKLKKAKEVLEDFKNTQK
jgi:hypothetical protein